MSEPSTAEKIASATKTYASAARDIAVSLSMLLFIGWFVVLWRPEDLEQFRLGPDGVEVKRVAQDVKVLAKQLDTTAGNLHTLEGRVEQIRKALEAYESGKSDEQLARLMEAIRATQRVASNVVKQADASSVVAAEATTRALELQKRVDIRANRAAADETAITGWIYLGKVSRSGRWLPSSALGTLSFDPPVNESKEILPQILAGKTVVRARGYKYLRSNDGVSGRRVDAAISKVLAPDTPMRINELDDNGKDPADGEKVLWANVTVAG